MRATTGYLLFGFASGVIFSAGVGCSGSGGPAVTADLPPSQRHKLRTIPTASAVLRLPAGEPFNVHDKRWGSAPGPSGKANPVADAKAGGTAFCRADAENGGTSWAEFELGHALDNETDKPIAAELHMTVDYEYACRAAGGGAKTAGAFAIKAFVKGTDGKTLQTIPLASHTSDDGPIDWSGTERTVNGFVLQPNLGYYVVVVGRVDAGSQEKASAMAEIKVKSLAMELAFKPAGSTTAAAKAK
jgi:hypothetical protein